MTSIGRAAGLAGLLGVLDDPGVDALDEGVAQPLGDRQLAPGEIGRGGPGRTLGRMPGSPVEQPLGRVRAAVENDVLDQLAQLRVDVVVDRQLAGVDDAHVHAGGDRVVQEDRVDRLADAVVAAEREADVAHAARDERAGQLGLDPPGGLDVRDRVVGVLLDPGPDREDVRVEDDVLRVEPGLVDEQPVGARRDPDLALDRPGLTLLVEGHDDDGRAVAPDEPGLAEELGFALLQADRVDDRPALDALQPGLDHRPLRRVDHDRHPGDVRLRRDEVEEAGHRRRRVEHPLVHVDVDELGAVLDLAPGDLERVVEATLEDDLGERARAGDVRPLADVDEDVARLGDDQRLEPGQAGQRAVRPESVEARDRGPPRRSPGRGPASSRSSRRRC